MYILSTMYFSFPQHYSGMASYTWVFEVIGLAVAFILICYCRYICKNCREDDETNRTQATTQSFNSNDYRSESQSHSTRHAWSISGNMDPSRPITRRPTDLPPSYDSVIASGGGGLSGFDNESYVHDNVVRNGEEPPPPYNYEPPSAISETVTNDVSFIPSQPSRQSSIPTIHISNIWRAFS